MRASVNSFASSTFFRTAGRERQRFVICIRYARLCSHIFCAARRERQGKGRSGRRLRLYREARTADDKKREKNYGLLCLHREARMAGIGKKGGSAERIDGTGHRGCCQSGLGITLASLVRGTVMKSRRETQKTARTDRVRTVESNRNPSNRTPKNGEPSSRACQA